jgi:hypothetical protein
MFLLLIFRTLTNDFVGLVLNTTVAFAGSGLHTPVHIGKMDADVAQRMKFYGSVEVILAGFVHLICL